MRLYWSARSPFVRKVMITLHETAQLNAVELVETTVAVHLPPSDEIQAANPLAKIPVLQLEDGQSVYDARVICEYLDRMAGTELFPEELTARVQQLRWQSLADGLSDILLIWRTEILRETGPWAVITQNWATKVRAALGQLDSDADDLIGADFGIGQISVTCALGQLDFRWPDCAWRQHFPNLARFEKQMALRNSVKLTNLASDPDPKAAFVTKGHLSFQQAQ